MAITFDSIGNGGLQEKFNMALRQIGRNILDRTWIRKLPGNDDQYQVQTGRAWEPEGRV